MLDTENPQAILKRIDDRQELVLEDLQRLNRRILDIIELHTRNPGPRAGDEEPRESPIAAAPPAANREAAA